MVPSCMMHTHTKCAFYQDQLVLPVSNIDQWAVKGMGCEPMTLTPARTLLVRRWVLVLLVDKHVLHCYNPFPCFPEKLRVWITKQVSCFNGTNKLLSQYSMTEWCMQRIDIQTAVSWWIDTTYHVMQGRRPHNNIYRIGRISWTWLHDQQTDPKVIYLLNTYLLLAHGARTMKSIFTSRFMVGPSCWAPWSPSRMDLFVCLWRKDVQTLGGVLITKLPGMAFGMQRQIPVSLLPYATTPGNSTSALALP
jgi:hypothetical protein